MNSRALSTVLTNLTISWGMKADEPYTLEWFNEAMAMFEGSDVRMVAAVVDEIRTGPRIELYEIKEKVRGRSNRERTDGHSEAIGYHRAEERPLGACRASVMNDGLKPIRFCGSETVACVRLGRAMIERARRDNRFVEDEPLHELFTMDELQIQPWLKERFEAPPDKRVW